MEKLTDLANDIDLAIRQNRVANATIRLSRNGAPLSNREIEVEQKNHKFLFGANWGESSIALANGELSGQEKERAELRNERFLQLFNQVTLPFYWARFEPVRGQPQTQRILRTAEWYRQRGCVVKGHPLCWHTLTADWLMEMSNREILQAQVELSIDHPHVGDCVLIDRILAMLWKLTH